MATTFIPGYLSEVTLGAVRIEPNLASGTMTFSKNIIDKPVAGAQLVTSIAGLKRVTLSVSGHISTEDFAKFETARASNAAVAYVFQIGDSAALSPTDTGSYTGTMLVESLTVAFDADDEWSFSMDCKVQTYLYAA